MIAQNARDIMSTLPGISIKSLQVRLCLPWVLALLLSALMHGQTPPASPEQTINKVFQMHESWGPALSSKGASITLKQTSREGQIFHYQIHAAGLPGNDTYSLVTWPIAQQEPKESLPGLKLDRNGTVICPSEPSPCQGKPGGPIDFAVSAGKGAPVRIGLLSAKDDKVRAFTKIVPLPIQSSDKGCTLDAVLLAPYGRVVVVEGRGFARNAPLKIERTGAGERSTGDQKSTADGSYSEVVLPIKKGVESGQTTVKITAPACAPAVTFDWGARK